MAILHMVLGSKGGIGKTLIASSLAQFINSARPDRPAICYDADPTNAALTHVSALNVKFLEGIFVEGEVMKEGFDPFVDKICAPDTAPDDIYIIDTGSNVYAPLVSFLKDTRIFELLAEHGNHTALHIPISGGDEYETTLECFGALCEVFAEAPVKIVPWINEFHGTAKSPDGIPFEKSETAKKYGKRFDTIMAIPAWSPEIRRVVAELFKAKETFAEGAAKHENQILVRQRILVAQREIFANISNSRVCEPSFFGADAAAPSAANKKEARNAR